jgi:hypothetical protein
MFMRQPVMSHDGPNETRVEAIFQVMKRQKRASVRFEHTSANFFTQS